MKREYGLTVDRREAAAIERILRGCDTTATEHMMCQAAPTSAGGTGRAGGDGADALARYDDNGNGRNTCKEACRHGIAPVHRSHPVYQYMRDGDGMVCEEGGLVNSGHTKRIERPELRKRLRIKRRGESSRP